MDCDIFGADHGTTNTDHDAFDTDLGTFDTNPNIVSSPAVINLHGTVPANVIPTVTNPGVVITMASPGVVIPTATTPSVTTPTTTNLGVITPPDIIGLTATNSTFGSVTSPATADPGADPTIVVDNTLGPTVTEPEVTIAAMSTPERTLASLDHSYSGQDLSHLAKSALGTAYPKFVTPEVITHLSSVTNIDGWAGLVQIYLKFEVASPSKSVSLIYSLCHVQLLIHTLQTTRLSAKLRPPEVNAWLKNPTVFHVSIADTAAYAEAWMGWWTDCQPAGRAMASWPFARELFSSTQWGRLLNGGKNGIFLFIMALSWWAKSLGLAGSSPDLIGAVADVEWVLHQLLDALTPPPAPVPILGVALEVPDTGRGKRKIVLTEKALDLGENVQKRYRR